MYNLDTSAKTPLHIQLYEAIKYDITTNLAVGSKLPSIRKVSQEYKISKNTVESAYNQLYAEGYIESRPKSGYFVADADFLPLSNHSSMLKESTTPPVYRYDFHPARLDKDLFPLKLYKRLFSKAINETIDFGAYTDGQGEYSLRVELCRYLSTSRGVKCDPSQIVVTGAFADAMSMIADLLQPLQYGFAIEDPGYYVTRRVFMQHGYDITPVPVDENGLRVETLKKSDAKIVYITPSHQYPTGVSMPVSQRLKLLAWAKEKNGFIIEDDYDSELTYRSRPIPSLQGLDTNDRVIYVGTFSKAFSPALRVGYIVLPHRLIKEYKNFHGYFSRVCLATQKTLELFLKDGHWERHLRKVRNLNRKKHDIMQQAINKHLGKFAKIVSEGGGLSINIRSKYEIDTTVLNDEAQKKGIKLYFTKDHFNEKWDAIRMGFGGLKENEIESAVKELAKIWRDLSL
ncbi:PLP-dependent aminotransferase family protein [Sulfurimonas sp. HSL-1716]|uniref:MocR-like pyridoxine biosynthesis transcription factor PdxR n=1 Tax=Hydrocurvibacter sulfurireducens TaxID=3131937 RepID=UPI0031F92E0B